jgi:hypothetical protein
MGQLTSSEGPMFQCDVVCFCPVEARASQEDHGGMNMRLLIGLPLLVFFGHYSHAQDLTVSVIDEVSKQPVANALVRLHYGCFHSMRPIELKQKTNSAGIAVFHSVTLSPLEFCVYPDLEEFSFQEEIPYLFTSPQDAHNYAKSLNRVFTALPGGCDLPCPPVHTMGAF